ncbi:MAG: DUF2752 domain-containing protein [Streptosporangiaceae bacterium]
MAGVVVGERRRALLGPLGALAGVTAGFLLVGMIDPNEQGHYPTCPLLAMTGVFCPGCGGLRMAHAIAHGQFGEAAGLNLLAFALLPVAAFVWVRWTISVARGRPLETRLTHPLVIGAFAALIVIFWVVRNLPFGHALAP